MKKKNLVLVHSFPTNSVMLGGLVDFLDDYFSVFFIDLPGFITTEPSLPKITLDAYSQFVIKAIEERGLRDYWLGGVSFGFSVVNNCQIGGGV